MRAQLTTTQWHIQGTTYNTSVQHMQQQKKTLSWIVESRSWISFLYPSISFSSRLMFSYSFTSSSKLWEKKTEQEIFLFGCKVSHTRAHRWSSLTSSPPSQKEINNTPLTLIYNTRWVNPFNPVFHFWTLNVKITKNLFSFIFWRCCLFFF